ncbi:MAG TPA: DNA starvation/stationary phase protection protein [Saprospiraceae bacterium]|nr:DNA starvation/stationary phase protection protein [Saprospiraceae bacterium]
MKSNIGIADKSLQKVANLLNTLLADEFTLYVKTRNAHWNVTGDNFHELHKFFENQYEQLDEIMDEVAERVRMLGHFSIGSLNDIVKNTRLTESKTDFGKQNNLIRGLLDDHETIIRVVRTEIDKVTSEYKDLGTGDFLTGLMERHEKMAWMLRAYLG